MRMIARAAVIATAISVLGGAAVVAQSETDIWKGPVGDRVEALAKIQPGLGTVMTEYGSRFVDAYYAAKGGNWGLAQYQLHEMLEIQEVGEATRPQHASELKTFEDAYLAPLVKTIEQKNWSKFADLYAQTIDGCNGCHAGTGHDYILFRLPSRPVEDYLDFSVKTDPSSGSK